MNKQPKPTYSETRAACAAYMAIGFASGLRDSDKEAVKSGGRAKNETLVALLEECAAMLLAKVGGTHQGEQHERD